MIAQYTLNQPSLVLECDLAGEFPLYLYWQQDKSDLLYSYSITELLNDQRLPKPLKVSTEGLSFLLQSGVVPPPKTVYENIFILGIGDKARISTVNGKIDVQFSHEFPFLNANRLQANEVQLNENLILQMLAEATISRIDESKPSFLFHSAGKDSNSIALAMAEAGWQDKITLITHKSKGQADESEISARIAKQLGFKHRVLHEMDNLEAGHKKEISDYFVNAPFPCTDYVSLAYPLYAHQLPELKGSNIIDGMGNDVYIGHIPSIFEFRRQALSKYMKHGRIFTKYLNSENYFHSLGRTRSEWTGVTGLSLSDTSKILNKTVDSSSYWISKDSSQDYLDFRASIRGTILDQEIFTRKVRNFSDSINANMILPWANQEVAEYLSKMPEEYLFDRKNLKNKIFLRKILKKSIGLDSDALGKLGFTYDAHTVIVNHLDLVVSEIQACTLWNESGLHDVLYRFIGKVKDNTRSGFISRNFIYRLYLISAWYNKCRYLN